MGKEGSAKVKGLYIYVTETTLQLTAPCLYTPCLLRCGDGYII